MGIFQRKSAIEREWQMLLKKEAAILKRRTERRELLFYRWRERKVTEKQHVMLYAACVKALAPFFERGRKNPLSTGETNVSVEGFGSRLLDIPEFIHIMMDSIYTIAREYEYEFTSEKERIFILLIIQGGVAHGKELQQVNVQLDRYIKTGLHLEKCSIGSQLKETSAVLSGALLYMKFLPDIPGGKRIGGLYDSARMKHITEYARLKYRYRFLLRQGAEV